MKLSNKRMVCSHGNWHKLEDVLKAWAESIDRNEPNIESSEMMNEVRLCISR